MAGKWIATTHGITKWRPALQTLTVEAIGELGQNRLVTVLDDGAVVILLSLSPEQANHLAGLLRPWAAA